jgi:sulfatase maturation enzyme AslB (radical SAM superfamily)
VVSLQKAGFKVGVWAVDAPQYRHDNEMMQSACQTAGIDFRWKEYLDSTHGTYHYPNSVGQETTKSCECKTNEILIAPDGNIFRCHADLYANRNKIGNILDKNFPEIGKWRKCDSFGKCNPCDLKVKFNRFQQPGNAAVKIKNIDETRLNETDLGK